MSLPCTNWIDENDLADCKLCNVGGLAVGQAEQIISTATQILYLLSGQQFPGQCQDQVRPCNCHCGPVYGDWRGPWPYRTGAGWQNVCGGCGGWCGASGASILLPRRPVIDVISVQIDGAPYADYRLDSPGQLVRTDGGVWPTCFVAGTMIQTNAGLRPIEEIQPGEMVLTHKNRWRRVVQAGKTGDSETVIVKGRGGRVRCTPDHRFWGADLLPTGRMLRKKLGAPGWVQAREMIGNAWAMPATVEPLPIPLPEGWSETELPDNFWWVVGRWLGDGWTAGDGKRVFICSGNHEGDELATELDRTGWNWRRIFMVRSNRFAVASPSLRGWLNENFGIGARNKEIPAWMFGAPESVRQAFLAGFVSADGWKAREGTLRAFTSVHTASQRLAMSLRLLVATLGFAPVFYVSNQKPSQIRGKTVESRGAFRVDWAASKPGDPKTQSWNDDEHLWGVVRSLEIKEQIVPVYDLEVEEDHSFVANGFVVHNCQNITLDIGETGTWEIIYTYGKQPPEALRFAATILSSELVKACIGDSTCRIPAGAVSVQRQGISYDFAAASAEGKTGLYEVDQILSAFNPGGRRRRARVYSPQDIEWARAQTGS